jgi:hypothetical protein
MELIGEWDSARISIPSQDLSIFSIVENEVMGGELIEFTLNVKVQ